MVQSFDSYPKKKKKNQFDMEIQPCSFKAPLSTNSTNQSLTCFLPEDVIVAGILPRLHVKALFRFKCVSVRYESIISDPKFGQKYVQRAYSSKESCSSSGLLPSFLFPTMNKSKHSAFTVNVKDLGETVNSSSHSQYPDDEDKLSIRLSTASLSCDHTNHRIQGSSGGLQLSLAYLKHTMFRDSFLCVSNPLTKQCVQLPKLSTRRFAEQFGISTRWDDVAASLTYKVVILRNDCAYESKTIDVFSSDTGSWVVWKVIIPTSLELCISYKGVLHWLDRRHGRMITYNPFDTPHQARCFRLPEGVHSVLNGQEIYWHKSLIYSGEEEVLKYCEIGECKPESGVKRFMPLMVWRLDEYDDGKWCLEGEFYVPSLKYGFERLMVAPYPWNRRVICHPYVKSNTINVLNPWDGTWKRVDILKDPKNKKPLVFIFYPAELCPWSSPLYAASSTNLL